MWAIVPLKSLQTAKSRLASVLDADERRTVMLAMARDVLTALAGSRRLSGVLLVSRAAEADALAQSFATERFRESPGADLSTALMQAARHAGACLDARGVMIVPADVPLVTPEDVDHVLDAHDAVTVIPDDERLGTNALLCSPPLIIDPLFDGRSFQPHLLAAQRAGVEPRVVPNPRFALDVDTVDDLAMLLARGGRSQTAAMLQKSGFAERLRPGGRPAAPSPQ